MDVVWFPHIFVAFNILKKFSTVFFSVFNRVFSAVFCCFNTFLQFSTVFAIFNSFLAFLTVYNVCSIGQSTCSFSQHRISPRGDSLPDISSKTYYGIRRNSTHFYGCGLVSKDFAAFNSLSFCS